ncbi:phytoene desaturase family protein [Kurthia huakuii]|uniref:phytoene desaturase family protein n=1 Tax=Kurthia huakuii TaxID=1421019 RepID=UPI0004BC4865|nr:NAD(P)/FAD-dependent oxidoreductase [Kurthia huakuii]MBM7698036.1 phytoene desaturase [Kurthia huakuii]
MMKIAVIGGSVGNLTAAICLAREGIDVSIYEKRDYIGGKLRMVQIQGYDFEIGPTMITAPEIIEQFIASTGRDIKDYMQIRSVRHHTQNIFPQLNSFFLSTDQAFMRKQLERLDPVGASNYDDFLAEITRMKQAFEELLTLSPLVSWRQLLMPPARSAYLTLKPFETIEHFVRRYFTNEEVIASFTRYASYNGIAPNEAPAMFIIHAYDELINGVYYVAGGNLRLVRVLQQIAKEEGIRYYTGKEVTKIHVDEQAIEGVCINDELSLEADAVLMSVEDFKAQPQLFADDLTEVPYVPATQPTKTAACVMLVALNTHTQIYHHHVIYSNDRIREFEMLKRGEMPDDPTVYLYNPAFSEQERFLRGDALLIFANMPYTTDEQRVEKMKQRIYDKLAEVGLKVGDYLVTDQLWSPAQLTTMFDQYRQEGQMKKITQFLLNPILKDHQIKSLYFTGMHAHPSAGIAAAIANGERVAKRMINELVAKKNGYG